MAYNPFNIFRRNQKAIFAVVTVVIMFMFVLSSGMTGKSDFFNWLSEWISSKKGGETLAKLDGSKITSKELDRIRRQRAMASKFMEYAAGETTENLQKVLLDQMAQGSPEFKIYFQMAMQDPRMAGMMLEQIAKNDKAKQADKDAAKTLEAMMSLSQSRFRAMSYGSYFSNVPNRPGYDRDAIQFLLWEKKAKQLGIDFSTDDVKTLISREFMGQFKGEVAVRRQMERDFPGFTLDGCLAALATEFRVRTAQTAIFGPISERADRTLSAPPVFTPAYELFDFYREKTSPTAYELLRVPVESFIPLVTEVPSENDLQRLFNEHKDYEPDPAKEEPGFRDPRKVKVEWISVTGDEPYYKKLASEYLTKGPIALALVPPTLGVWGTIAVVPLGTTDPLLHEKYKFKVDTFNSHIKLGWDFSPATLRANDLLETSLVKPQNLVAAAGGAAGSVGIGNAFMTPSVLLYSATVAAEQRARIKACLPLVLGSVPGPAMLQTMVGGEVAFRKNIPEPLSIEVYKPELLKELSEAKARELAVNDLKKLKESIVKLTETGKARDAAAKDLIADFIKTRGVKTGSSTEFQSEFTIGDDPGLAPLKAIKDKGFDGVDPHTGMPGRSAVQFGTKFFWATNPMTGARESAMGNFKPDFYPERAAEMPVSPFGKPEPVFLAWRTADQIATGLSFTAAKPRVLEAWKRMKARDLAKAEAERLANELRAKPGESEFLIFQNMSDMEAALKAKTVDPKAKDHVKLFRIDNVAPLAITRDLTGRSFDENVSPFRLTATPEIPYPTAEMTKALLDERTKPIKTVFVQADQPKDSYYVIALLERRERPAEEFKANVFGRLGRNSVRDQIMGAHFVESRKKAAETILALLKKEFNYTETEDQKKKLDDREKKGGNDE